LQHESDHGDLNHGLAIFNQFFIVLAEATGMAQPSKRAFHDPAFGKDLKTNLLFELPNDLQHPTTPAIEPLDQLSGVTAIGPHQ